MRLSKSSVPPMGTLLGTLPPEKPKSFEANIDPHNRLFDVQADNLKEQFYVPYLSVLDYGLPNGFGK